jgi:hypothetical protein
MDWPPGLPSEKTKKEISSDTSSDETRKTLSFLNSRHAPFFLFVVTSNNIDLSLKCERTFVGAPPTFKRRRQLLNSQNVFPHTS